MSDGLQHFDTVRLRRRDHSLRLVTAWELQKGLECRLRRRISCQSEVEIHLIREYEAYLKLSTTTTVFTRRRRLPWIRP
jgi:hypothetical protein